VFSGVTVYRTSPARRSNSDPLLRSALIANLLKDTAALLFGGELSGPHKTSLWKQSRHRPGPIRISRQAITFHK
jgi:hypothetical protein